MEHEVDRVDVPDDFGGAEPVYANALNVAPLWGLSVHARRENLYFMS
jgi:hypothetical protein